MAEHAFAHDWIEHATRPMPGPHRQLHLHLQSDSFVGHIQARSPQRLRCGASSELLEHQTMFAFLAGYMFTIQVFEQRNGVLAR